MNSLREKTILVTGASSGIGRATADLCARQGARIVVTGRDEGRLGETLHLLAGEGHRAVTADLSRADAVERLIDESPALDGLVCNAGMNIRRPVPYIRDEDTENLFSVNAFAPFRLVTGLVQARKLNAGASIVFTTSVAGRGVCSTGNGLYAASKAALSAFARHAALELSAKGIRVNSIAPGVVETPFLVKDTLVSREQWEAERANCPLGRFGKPEDIATAIVFFLSDDAAWITGAELVVDGGRSLK